MKNKQICLVTGASSGIGFGIARALAEDGHQVIATARRMEKLKRLCLPEKDMIACDLSTPEYQDKLEDYIFSTYGRCDYLFNCAGSLVVGTIDEMDIEKMSAMLRLNVEATFRLSYKFLKRFQKQNSGHIINLSSVLGTKVRPTAGAYAASKYALEALSEALRMELTGTNIQVSCIEPGLVMTELHNDWEVHPRESMQIRTPLETEDIIRIVRFIMDQPAHVRIPKLMVLPKDHEI